MSNDETNNINDDVPDDDECPMVLCHITDEEIHEADAVSVPMTRHMQYMMSRYEAHVRNCTSIGESAPTRDEYAERNGIHFVWVSDQLATGYCDECGHLYCVEDDDTISDSGVNACASCSHYWNWCDDHDRYWHNDEGGCEYCDSEDEGSHLIHDYSYRPSASFHYITKDGDARSGFHEIPATAVTGFELEMEAVNCEISDAATLADRLLNGITYLKHDGSLDNGFEVVSHPMTLEYINKQFNFAALKELADLGMRSAKTRTCGLHVHINKSYFRETPTTLYRFMSLFYGNSEQWQRLAGRSESSYARWDLSEGSRMLSYVRALASGDRYTVNEDRYVAINLQPSHTVEMRFFKGSMNPNTIQARLQAIHACAEYAVESRFSASITKHSNWDAFRVWTSARDDRFSHFNNYANSKGV